MILQGKTPVTEIVLHTSATKGDWWKGKTVDQMRDTIRQWHTGKGWKDIGYHLVIAPDGSCAKGRAFATQGAHVRGHNKGTIGICLIPVNTHDGITRFEDYFTPEQRRTLKAWIQAIPGIEKVTGHNQYANRECPGFRVVSKEWMTLTRREKLQRMFKPRLWRVS